MLEHHSQTGAQCAQLLFVSDFQLTIFVTYQRDVLVIDHDGAFTWFFEEVDAA